MKDLGLWVILFLPILPVRDVLKLADVAPAADDAVGGARIDAEGGGEEEYVRIDGVVGIDSEDVRKASGDDGYRAENEDVRVFRRV